MPDHRTNREIKTRCPDFAPVRQLLKSMGAALVDITDQVDHYYHLPPRNNTDGTRRLKLRIEKGRGELIYYADRQENGARTSRVQLWRTDDPSLDNVLDSALVPFPARFVDTGKLPLTLDSCLRGND